MLKQRSIGARWRHGFLAAGLLGGLAACSNYGTDVVCLDYAAAGLNVTAVDSITGTTVTSVPITVVAREGSYTETETRTLPVTTPPTSIGMVWERAGTYTVEVTAPGYAPWTRSGVLVAEDECHVIGVLVAAKLQRI
jgi:hypothetical protein